MTRANIQGINKAIAHHQIEMIKGCGYFYFMPAMDAPVDLDLPEIDSVYVCHITDMTKEQWIAHVNDAFQPKEKAMTLYEKIYNEVRLTLNEADSVLLATRLSEMSKDEIGRLFKAAGGSK